MRLLLNIILVLAFIAEPALATLQAGQFHPRNPVVDARISSCAQLERAELQMSCLQNLMQTYRSARIDPWVSMWRLIPEENRRILGERCGSATNDYLKLRCFSRILNNASFAGSRQAANYARQVQLYLYGWGTAAYQCLRTEGGNTSLCENYGVFPTPSEIPGPEVANWTFNPIEVSRDSSEDGEAAIGGGRAGGSVYGNPDGADDGSHYCELLTGGADVQLESCNNPANALQANEFIEDIHSMYAYLTKNDYFSLLKIRLIQIQTQSLVDAWTMAGQCNRLSSPPIPANCRQDFPSAANYLRNTASEKSEDCNELQENRDELVQVAIAAARERKRMRCHHLGLQVLGNMCDRQGHLNHDNQPENPNRPFPAECNGFNIQENERKNNLFVNPTLGGVELPSSFGLVSSYSDTACPRSEDIVMAENQYRQYDLHNPIFASSENLESILLSDRTSAAKLAALRAAGETMARALQTDLGNTCSNSYDAGELVRYRALAQSVLAAAPEFQQVDQCFSDWYQDRDRLTQVARSIMRACSMIGLIPVPPTLAIGTACMAGEIIVDSGDYLANRSFAVIARELARTVGGRALTLEEADEMQRIEDLLPSIKSQALMLSFMAVATAVAHTPRLIRIVRQRLARAGNPSAAADEMMAIERELTAGGSGGARSIAEAGEVSIARLTVAETASAKEAIKQRMIASLGEAQARARFPCLF